ncbi:MFS transporter [Halonotius aquaticus]|uniref:MFS transporter n=1 Tax=Halonotius aquaticus TaxID=2216978 RepID=A0A3A6Q7C2_9EURY|nr:MFS transporter [Halonotius aquaticus]RJX43011.1 MFS transporter [Halonotius aquaticus]
MNANDRAITGFAMAGHAMVHTYELAVPILLTVWLVEFSVTSATLGTVVAVGYGLFGVGALPGGVLVDLFGSRRLIVACLFGMGSAFVLLGLLPGVAGIAVALAVWGLAASVYHPAGLTLISKGADERGAAFAYHGMAANVGIAGGPFLTALLLVVVEWRLAVVLLAIPAFIAGAVGLTVEFDETAAINGDTTASDDDSGKRAGDERAGEKARDDASDTATAPEVDSLAAFVTASRGLFTAGFLTVFVLVLFNGLYYRGMVTFLPEVLSDVLDPLLAVDPAAAIGPVADSPAASEFDLSQYLYAGLLAVGVAGQYVGGRLTDAIEPERGLAVMLTLLVVIALLFVPASGSLPTLMAISTALGFALFGLQPLSQATIAKYSPPAYRGLSFGFTYLAIFGIGALGASLAGAALTYGSQTTLFVMLAGFEAIALGLAVWLIVRA